MTLKASTLCLAPVFMAALIFVGARGSSEEGSTESAVATAGPERYIKALQNFQVHSNESFKSSCMELTVSIKNMLRFTDAKRWDQLTAPMYAFADSRRDLFPDTQYRIKFQLHYFPRLDILIHRLDGTLFCFGWCIDRIARAMHHIQRVNATGRYFRNILRPVSHTVFGAFIFKERVRGQHGPFECVVSSYLLDSFNPRFRYDVNITV